MQREPHVNDAIDVAGALYDQWWHERAETGTTKRTPKLRDKSLQIAVALWLEALITALERLAPSIAKQNLVAACRSMREQLVFWESKAALREIVAVLRSYPEGVTVHDQLAKIVRAGGM